MIIEIVGCVNCPFDYDTIQCKANPKLYPGEYPYSQEGGSPGECPLKKEPVTVKLKEGRNAKSND